MAHSIWISRMGKGSIRPVSWVILLYAVALALGQDPDTEPLPLVRLMTLDPGHFHAALVHKTMYQQVWPVVHIYAPEGPELQDHLGRMQQFNTRQKDPTSWVLKVYTGPDYLERMLQERPGNVVVISGNNARKTDYILACVQAGLNVLADKPMVISPERFSMLEQAFELAKRKGVLVYDIMTERYEIATILQNALAQIPDVFGQLEKGTPQDPSVIMESVHHFYKSVAGSVVKRPGWFFDIRQQGEGIVDVATHLVDLVQLACFPQQVLDKGDIKIIAADRWPTELTLDQFRQVTGLERFPEYLTSAVDGNALKVYCNGQFTYRIKDVHARITVVWNYQAPPAGGDSHASVLRGTRCSLVIRQGSAEAYQPTLYVEANRDNQIAQALEKAIRETLQTRYPGIDLTRLAKNRWRIEIPDKYRVGHEAHFAQVMQLYLEYLARGRIPNWETSYMLAKYYTTTEALRAARH